MIMMKFKNLLVVLFISIINAGCSDFLDKPASEDITESDAYSNIINAQKVLNNIYYEAATGLYNPISRRFGYELATNEAVQGYASLWPKTYKQGAITADTDRNGADNSEGVPPSTRMWRSTYAKIRKANIFISKIMSVPGDEDLKKRFLAEARFLRAFFYFHLIRDYGGCVILEDVLDDYTEATTVTRSTFSESVNWVVNELDEVVWELPNESELILSSEFGRATRGAALALKARLLLYAARPLFNTNSPVLPDYTEIQYYGNYDRERWKIAADAAQAVIDEGFYSLWKGTYDAASGSYPEDKTQMFMDMFYTHSAEYVWGFYPVYDRTFNDAHHNRSAAGWNWINPTLEMAEEFEMTNGKMPNDSGSGYDFQNPGKDRDPRFKATIQYPGAEYESYKMESWAGGKASHFESCITGMCIQKWMDGTAHPNMSTHPTNGFVCPLIPYFRYAEILLNQAEALNEYYDEPSQDSRIYDNLNAVRDRVGMPKLPEGLTKEQMRNRIKHERHVELAFEDHYFFDILTWRDAEVVLNKEVHGYDVTKGKNEGFWKKVVVGDKQIFTKKMYLSPISTYDILLNKNLVQNPGY